MADREEPLQQNSSSEDHKDQNQDQDGLRLDIPSPRVMSSESEPNTGSTIYDPAVLEINPEYRAVVEQRHDRDVFGEDNDHKKGILLHVSSPAARNHGELDIGEARIRLPKEIQEQNEQELQERELCCHGFLPLFQSMIAFSLISVLIGITCVGIGASQLSSGNKDVVGFGSSGRLVISGSFLLTIFALVLGSLFILCGFLGALANYVKAYRSPKSGKLPDMVYHCLLFLVTLLCIIVFGLNMYSVSVRQSGPIYDTELWKEFVRSNPRHLCKLEGKLHCAGMNLGHCLSDSNETRHTFCPGHFCVDFCRIADTEVSKQPICDSCKKDPLESIPLFAECRALEKERSSVETCAGLPDKVLDKMYGRLLVSAVIGFSWVLVVWTVIAYVECFL